MNQFCQQIEYNKFTTRILEPCYQLEYMETLSQLFRRRITELGISNSELARRAKKSRSYVGNIVNETAPTKSGKYDLTPDSVKDFAKALEISEIEILSSIGYAQENSPQIKKPTTVIEFFEILEEMGLDVQFSGGFKMLESLDAEDLQELLDGIVANASAKAKRKMRKK